MSDAGVQESVNGALKSVIYSMIDIAFDADHFVFTVDPVVLGSFGSSRRASIVFGHYSTAAVSSSSIFLLGHPSDQRSYLDCPHIMFTDQLAVTKITAVIDAVKQRLAALDAGPEVYIRCQVVSSKFQHFKEVGRTGYQSHSYEDSRSLGALALLILQESPNLLRN